MSSKPGFKLFPSYDISPRVLELKDFHIDITFEPTFTVSVQNNEILKGEKDNSFEAVKWFGDGLLCQVKKNPTQTINFHIVCYNSTLILKLSQNYHNLFEVNEEALTKLQGQSQQHKEFLTFSLTNDDNSQLGLEKIEEVYNTWKNKIDEWYSEIPSINRYINASLWNFNWTLYRTNTLPQDLPDQTNKSWIKTCRLCKESQFQIDPWDSIHMIDDLMWYRSDLAKNQLIKIFDQLQQPDGRISNVRYQNYIKNESNISSPPMWFYNLLELSKFTNDHEIIFKLYDNLKRNIKWWEQNRFNKDFQLFEADLTAEEMSFETAMINSPRFTNQHDGRKWIPKNLTDKRHLLLVDLNSQMGDFYQNMGVFGMIANDSDNMQYFQKAESLQDNVQEILWDVDTKFYYDFDLETETLQPIKTIAGFWPLQGGLASKAHIVHMINHLKNSNEFWSELPTPTVALDEKFHSKNIGHGPVLISQNFWLINGLKRYNQHQMATKLAIKLIEYINNSFDLYNNIYEYYPPMSFNVNSIKYNDQKYENSGYYLGSNPIHSIVYRGLLGAEILDEWVNFVPSWNIISKEINFSFYYQNKKIEAYLSKVDNRILEIPQDH
jgi:mannosylglycerate hydrolase MGH1-like protein